MLYITFRRIVIRRSKRDLSMYIHICEYGVIVIHVCIRTTLSYIYYTYKQLSIHTYKHICMYLSKYVCT